MITFTFDLWSVVSIVAATVVSTAIGMLWYSPVLFGKKWMELVGMDPVSVSPDARRNGQKAIALSLIATLATACILYVFIQNLFVVRMSGALLSAFLIWFGFMAPVGALDYIFTVKPKPWTLYGIHTGFQLVSILVMAATIFYLM